MADDHAPSRADAVDTDEGREAYMRDLETRSPVPERMRYPETDEDYVRMVGEAEAEIERGEFYTLEEVRAHFADRVASARASKPK